MVEVDNSLNELEQASLIEDTKLFNIHELGTIEKHEPIPELKIIVQACKCSPIGKLLPDALYVHISALTALEQVLQQYEIFARSTYSQKDAWISAIVNYQASKIQKVTLAAPDNQALAQAELDSYIADQAQAIAPEPLTIVEISFDHHEYYADDKLIASISHDDNHLTQRWVVMVNDEEVFRANTLMRCDRFICTHYKDGTLLVKAEVQGSRGAEGKNLQQLSPLPLCASAPQVSSSTENQIMAHIFNECQNYGFEILDDGIYNNGVKLGQVGCTDGNWWVKRRYSAQQQYSNSVLDAVRSLSIVDVSTNDKSIFDEYFLDQPLEQLTGDKLQRLLERTELVTA